jgi:hypothetical protein
MRQLVAVVIFFAFASGFAPCQRSRKDIPAAPLPEAIVHAQKIFLSNGGGSDLAYDAFYSDIKAWGKYQIVGSPDDADLIVELAYRVVDEGTHVWSSTNTYTGATQVHSREVTDPQLVLTIYDAKTKNSLWSTVDHRKLAGLEKNREKETIKSAERLVDELRTRAAIPQ